MALRDFDTDQLATDALAIAGADGTASESFLLSGVTYYGVFTSTDLGFTMDTVGFKDEREIRLSMARASLTAGIAPNAFLLRAFDSTTWQVVRGTTDEGWHDYTLRRHFST
jgi:hypothetical protein